MIYYKKITILNILGKMGGKLSQPNLQKNIQSGQTSELKYASISIQGWQRQMQSCQLCKINIGPQNKSGNSLFAIFDGIRGFQVSYFLKETFLSVFVNSQPYIQGNYQQALKYTFQKLDELILSQRGQKRLRQIRTQNKAQIILENQIVSDNTGSTAAVILITKKKVFIASIGSFKIYIIKNSKPIILTDPVKPQNFQEKLRIEKAGGQVIKGRINGNLNISRAFGFNSFKKNNSLSWEQQMISCSPIIKILDKSATDDFIFMGCEGFWENYQNRQTEKLLQIQKLISEKSGNLNEGLKQIVDQIIPLEIKTDNNLGYKNMSISLIKFNQV